MCFMPKYALFDYFYNEDTKKMQKKIRFVPRLPDIMEKNIEISKNYIVIPCGKCLACRINQANDWATRCYLESKKYTDNCFLTLTYDEEHVPKNASGINSVKKRDVQTFLKLLRYYVWKNYSRRIKFFCISEYGPTTFRPHYHIIIFNFMPDDLKFYKNSKTGVPMYNSDLLHKVWNKGFVVVQYLNYANACYCARYTQKKAERIEGYDYYDKLCDKLNVEREFKTSSRRPGIALDVLKNKEEFAKIRRSFGVMVKTDDGVKIKGIPQALRQKWRDIDEIEYYNKADERSLQLKKQQIDILNATNLTHKEYTIMVAKKTEQNLRRLKRSQIV